MGPNAHAGPKHGASCTIAMDKIDEQSSTGFHPSGSVDRGGVVARLGFLGLWLE